MKNMEELKKTVLSLWRTDWSEFWPNRKKYSGDDRPMKTDNLHFPSFGKKAVEFLISERKIKAIGIDTASTDYGPSEMFQVHRVSAKANVIGFRKFKKI